MASLVTGDIFRAAYYLARGEKFTAVVRTYRVQIGPGTLTYAQCATKLRSDAYGELNNLYDDRIALGPVTCTRVWPTAAPPEGVIAEAPFTGTSFSHFLPIQTAGLVQLRAATAPSRSRGHIYFPFPREADRATDGKPSVMYQANLRLAAVGVARPRIVGFSPLTTVVPVLWRKGTPAFWGITSHHPRPYFATQRRRTRPQNVRTL